VNPLRQLQEDVTNLLLGNPDTAAVAYTLFRKQVIELEADAGLIWKVRQEGKVGVACLILMPSCTRDYPNVPGVQLQPEIIVRTFEDPKVNNTGLSAEDVAIANLEWLDDVQIGGFMALYADWKGPALKPNYDFPGFVCYDSVLSGKLPRASTPRTENVVISDDNAGTVTLSCSDAGAVIYYTVSGEMPRIDAEGLSLMGTLVYNGPFAVPSGTEVRALALAEGKRQSNVDEGVINF
jgi:hypothetical protein